MRGHVRQRGKIWSYVIELGDDKTQRCTVCNRRHWVDRRPFEKCERCGGELRNRVERRQREQSGFKTKKEAEAALTTELGKIQTGTYIAPDKITLREFLSDEWLPAVKATIKPTTYLSYEIHVGRHINPGLGSIPLQKLSGAAINAFYARLLTEPRKPALQPRKREEENERGKDRRAKEEPEPQKTPEPLSVMSVRKIHATLHKALADAVRWNRVPRNPVDAADPPKTKSAADHEMKTWTAKELQTFLASSKESRFYPLWLILASTGMRRGEALGLRWEDVDMENSRVAIRQNMVTVGYKVHIGKPKTGRGRNISIDAATLRVLKVHRSKQLEEKMLWKKTGYLDSGFVFRRENGQPYHPDSVSQAFGGALKASGLPLIRLHDLRHTHATLALQAGIHPKIVSERLGHANVSITLDVYSHAIPAMEEEAAAKIAALFMPA